MNKFKLLVAPLLVLPFIAACNNGGRDNPGEVKFSLSSDQPITVKDKTATVHVDWTPNDIIKFESFTFTATPTKPNSVTFDQTDDPRPMPVKITFTEDITENISGTLSFKYEDVTARTKGEGKLNVTIPKPENDPTVTKDEFDHAVNFDGIKRMQVNQEDNVTVLEQTSTVQSIYETSELVCHVIQIQKVGAAETANETYAKIENVGDADCFVVSRKSETEWYDPQEGDSEDYPFVSSWYNPINIIKRNYKNFEPTLEYDNFSDTDGIYNYQGTAKNTYDKDVSLTVTFTFKNKVLVNYSMTMDQPEVLTSQSNIAYTFEDIVPTWPL